jgi:hypothetical protein
LVSQVSLLDYGVLQMPPSVTRFVVVVNTEALGLEHISTELADNLTALISTVYPERLATIYLGPVNVVFKCAPCSLNVP